MKQYFLRLICLGLFAASCGTPRPSTPLEVKQAIIKKYERMRTTLKDGDPTFVLAMHTRDAILFLPDGRQIAGIDLQPFYEKVAATGIDIESTPTTVELLTHDVAFEAGTFTSTSKIGVQNTSQYINVWKKDGSDWKIWKAIDQAVIHQTP